MSQARILFQPGARLAMRRGFNQLADAITVTLGPNGRKIAMQRENSRRAPELLDDGATIARRFLGLPDRFETMGAFLARHIAWQMEEAVGDGATTAVLIARHILNEVDRQVAAGHNVMLMRRGVEKGYRAVVDALEQQVEPLESPEQIVALAESIAGNEEIARYIEEVFDVVGPHGAVDVRSNYGRAHTCRYINGTFWNKGWASSYFTTEGGTAIVKEPYILLTNRHLSAAEELAPILERVHEDGERGLVVIAGEIGGDALNILVANKTKDILPTLAIKAPGLGPEKTDVLQDLAVVTGARVILAETDERVEDAQLVDLGQAREVQAIRSGFTLIGGKGRPAAIRQRNQELQQAIPQAAYGRDRNRLRERAGKLLGGIALIEVGGVTDAEREYLKDRVKEAVHVVRHGLQGGVVPGGGAALWNCRGALDCLDVEEDERAGVEVLRSALAAPMQAILQNSGYEPGAIMDRIARCNGGQSYDVVRGEMTEFGATNIVDPVEVVRTGLRVAVSGALMGVTTEVLVHRPRLNRDEEVDFTP